MIKDIILYKPYGDNTFLETYIEPGNYADDSSRNDIHKTLETNRVHYNGLGIAANQLGISERAFNIDGRTYFNPEVLLTHGDPVPFSEGCLSFLSVRASIKRSPHVNVQYIDMEGVLIEEELTGLNAVAFQHELDHLNGRTMVDNINSSIQKKKFLDKFKKSLKKK